VQLVIRHDKEQIFLFATLQSAAGRQALAQAPRASSRSGSLILQYKGKYYARSSGVLRAARLLDTPWPLLYAFIIIPGFIRNAVYDWVARKRYVWMGKRDSCMIPNPELQNRFLT